MYKVENSNGSLTPNSIITPTVMLSEVRRQPNEVEAPHARWRRLRPKENFHPHSAL